MSFARYSDWELFAAVCIQRCVFSIAFFSKNIAGKFLNHPDCKSSVMNSAGFMAAKVAARVAAALFGPKSAIFMPRNHKRRYLMFTILVAQLASSRDVSTVCLVG